MATSRKSVRSELSTFSKANSTSRQESLRMSRNKSRQTARYSFVPWISLAASGYVWAERLSAMTAVNRRSTCSNITRHSRRCILRMTKTPKSSISRMRPPRSAALLNRHALWSSKFYFCSPHLWAFLTPSSLRARLFYCSHYKIRKRFHLDVHYDPKF